MYTKTFVFYPYQSFPTRKKKKTKTLKNKYTNGNNRTMNLWKDTNQKNV